MDYKNNLWVADSMTHTIYYISKEVETWNALFKVSGTEGKPGARNGNIKSATFNAPESLFVHEKSAVSLMEEPMMRPIWLKYPEEYECLYCNYKNFTKCGVEIDENFPYSIVDHKRVKYIPFVKGLVPDFFKREDEKFYFFEN